MISAFKLAVSVQLDGNPYMLFTSYFRESMWALEAGKGKGKVKEGKPADRSLAMAMLRARATVRASRRDLERFLIPLQASNEYGLDSPAECSGCGVSGPGCSVCKRVNTFHGPMLAYRLVRLLGVVVRRHDLSWLHELPESIKLGVVTVSFPRKGLSPVEERCLVIKDGKHTILVREVHTTETDLPSWEKQPCLFELGEPVAAPAPLSAQPSTPAAPFEDGQGTLEFL